MTIDQLTYTQPDPNSPSDSTIPLVKNSQHPTENFEVGMYSFLMGTFVFLPQVMSTNTISTMSRVVPQNHSF